MKIMDTINAINQMKPIRELIEKRDERCKEILIHYQELCSGGKVKNAIEVQRFMQAYWFDIQNQIEDIRLETIKEELRQRAYQDKLNYMINGVATDPENTLTMYNDERSLRGFMIIDQKKEIHIVDSTTKLADLVDRCGVDVCFTVYKESELNLDDTLELGKVLYRIQADGRLKKLKDNYKY